MKYYSIKDLGKSEKFLNHIRWNITPKIFLAPKSPGTGNKAETDSPDGYMLYVDIVDNKPTIVIMQMKFAMSKTVGYIEDVPEDLLRETLNCAAEECKAGMYPLTENLKDWLKKELGIS